MKRLLALTALLALPALAQDGKFPDHYIATANTTALTLQQPASNARQISFAPPGPGIASVSVYCASASTATFSWSGTAATATAGSEIKLPGTQQPSGMTVWTGSNVGAGTSGQVNQIAAGQTAPFDLSWVQLGTQGTAANFTVTTSNSCTITIAYSAK